MNILQSTKLSIALLSIFAAIHGYLHVHSITSKIGEDIVTVHDSDFASKPTVGSNDNTTEGITSMIRKRPEHPVIRPERSERPSSMNDVDGDDGDDGDDNNDEDENVNTDNVTIPRIPTLIIAGTQKGGTDALRFYLASHPKMLDSIQNEVHFFDKKCEEELDKLCDRAVIEKKKLLEDESSEVATEVIQQVRDEYASNWHFWKLNKNHHHRNNHDNDNDEDEGDNKLIPSISMQSKYTFEKTPRYLFHPFVPSRIKAVVPWTKIIILLRDPLERAYSQFKMDYERKILQTNKRRKKDVSSYGEVTFETCVDIDIQKLIEVGILGDDEKVLDADDDDENERRWLKYWDIWDEDYLTKEKVCDGEIARGLYYFQLQRWFKEYSTAEDRDKIFITKSESLLPDKKTKVIDMKAMTDFIGIDEMEVVAEEKIHATSSEFGPMQDETKQRLQAIYDPFNKKLGDILGEGWDDPWPYGQ